MSDELKPCPFCGSKHVTAYARTCNKDSKYDPADRAFPIVRCRECGACSEGRDWSEPITAITKWNARAESMTAQLESLRAQVATLTAELANKSRLFASCDAAHTELTEQYLEVTRELARVKALVAGSQTVGYYVYVSEHQNAYIVEDADEAIDDLTNHGAQITELIARPNLNLEQKP